MSEKFELGPVQKAWVDFLRNNGDKQGFGILGKFFSKEDCSLCVLGAGFVVLNKLGLTFKEIADFMEEYPEVVFTHSV